MIVYRRNNPSKYDYTQITKDCWFCDNPLWNPDSESDTDFAVMWAGNGHESQSGNVIYLHPDCAMHLSTRLIRDVIQGGMNQPQFTKVEKS